MLAWLSENIGTIVICALLVLIAAAILISLIKNKKKGRTSCGCGCSNCPMSSSCHRKK